MKEREFIVERDGRRIYTVLRTEEGEGKRPVLILSHGYGGDGRGEEGFARYFAERGFLTCAVDFPGGGRGSRSDGETWEMSVLTEAKDLNAIIDHFKTDDRFNRIFLWGASQGGFVSSYVAGQRPQDVAAMVLEFPAFA